MNQDDYNYNFNMAFALTNLKKYEESLKYYDKIIEFKPNADSSVYNNKACNLYSLGKFEEAIICCDKAIKLDPNIVLLMILNAMCLLKLGKNARSFKKHSKGN